MPKMPIEIVFDSKIFSADAILGACHKFLAKCFITLEHSEDGKRIIASLTAREGVSAEGLEDEFRAETLNYAVKQKINKGSAKIRDQIFHIVFNPERLNALGGQLQTELETKADPDSVKLSARLEKLLEEIESEESMGYEEDPLGIAVPWEEKHGMPGDLLHPVDQLKRQAENNLINIETVKEIVDC
ncbi:MAG TPA: hypothetical protein PLK80_09275 [bacterium]|nr:MAG: hypothetical protein BWY28_00141 [bacterium ADurb.Bin236]HOY63325.1 hypothetical protein [bacterium]HPI76913.1 hypothetical protein [bacterium]HPN94939.1 hypothetical protein [bacterium]